MKRLYVSLIVVILLSILGLWKSEGAKPEIKPQAITPNLQDEKLTRRKANFQKGRTLLLKKNVPFDPDELLKRGWQQKLKTTFEQMPELQVIQQADNKLEGAQLAHTLYLPENVQLTGDTVILVRRLVFLGSNVVIKGPHDIHIFTIDETQLVSNRSLKRDGGRMVQVGFLPPSTLASLKPTQGQIRIGTSGAGRDEWKQQRRLQQLAQKSGRSKDLHHVFMQQSQDGDPGADGQTGPNGDFGQAGASGGPGTNGSCPSDINGGFGNSGADGADGGNGGNGGNGDDGQNGGSVSFTAEQGQSYTVSANGGRGGNGGFGGNGGDGGNGGSGGRGGNGATCSTCTFNGQTASGGTGGFAGAGGKAGSGGADGNGGKGGNGGSIDVTLPPNFNGSISASVAGGVGGTGGGGGQPGRGGSAGSPGDGGSGAHGFNCSNNGGSGSTGSTANPGSGGNGGNSGQPGANGTDGSYNTHGGEGGCQATEECAG